MRVVFEISIKRKLYNLKHQIELLVGLYIRDACLARDGERLVTLMSTFSRTSVPTAAKVPAGVTRSDADYTDPVTQLRRLIFIGSVRHPIGQFNPLNFNLRKVNPLVRPSRLDQISSKIARLSLLGLIYLLLTLSISHDRGALPPR